MASKLTIKFEQEFTPRSGMQTYVSWERLKYTLIKELRLRENEKISGLVIGEEGIQCGIISS